MANNTNAAAIYFSNNEARVAASTIAAAYFTAKKLISSWNGQNMVSLIPNDINKLDDGSLAAGTYPGQPTNGDGRLTITDGQVNILISNSTSLVNFFEANSNLILNQTLQIASAQSRI